MKQSLMATSLLGAALLVSVPAQANNRNVESALSGYGDLSVFYDALLNTGVLAALDENTNYTILAPTNAAFAAIQPNLYPCFYSVECRAQVADVLRDHIMVGRRSLNELAREGAVPTMGPYSVYASSPYIGDYTVANHRVLSNAEFHGNMIYRIDGVIISNQQLAQFQAMPPATVAERTITTYHSANLYPVPGGDVAQPGTESVTTQSTYLLPSNEPVAYPDQGGSNGVYTPASGYPGANQNIPSPPTIMTQP